MLRSACARPTRIRGTARVRSRPARCCAAPSRKLRTAADAAPAWLGARRRPRVHNDAERPAPVLRGGPSRLRRRTGGQATQDGPERSGALVSAETGTYVAALRFPPPDPHIPRDSEAE